MLLNGLTRQLTIIIVTVKKQKKTKTLKLLHCVVVQLFGGIDLILVFNSTPGWLHSPGLKTHEGLVNKAITFVQVIGQASGVGGE